MTLVLLVFLMMMDWLEIQHCVFGCLVSLPMNTGQQWSFFWTYATSLLDSTVGQTVPLSTCAALFQTPTVSWFLNVSFSWEELSRSALPGRFILWERRIPTVTALGHLLVGRRLEIVPAGFRGQELVMCQVMDGGVQEFQNNIVSALHLSFQFFPRTTNIFPLAPLSIIISLQSNKNSCTHYINLSESYIITEYFWAIFFVFQKAKHY